MNLDSNDLSKIVVDLESLASIESSLNLFQIPLLKNVTI